VPISVRKALKAFMVLVALVLASAVADAIQMPSLWPDETRGYRSMTPEEIEELGLISPIAPQDVQLGCPLPKDHPFCKSDPEFLQDSVEIHP